MRIQASLGVLLCDLLDPLFRLVTLDLVGDLDSQHTDFDLFHTSPFVAFKSVFLAIG